MKNPTGTEVVDALIQGMPKGGRKTTGSTVKIAENNGGHSCAALILLQAVNKLKEVRL